LVAVPFAVRHLSNKRRSPSFLSPLVGSLRAFSKVRLLLASPISGPQSISQLPGARGSYLQEGSASEDMAVSSSQRAASAVVYLLGTVPSTFHVSSWNAEPSSGVTILSHCVSRRMAAENLSTCNGWRRLFQSAPRLLILLALIASWSHLMICQPFLPQTANPNGWLMSE
jgi:hypothetical protein